MNPRKQANLTAFQIDGTNVDWFTEMSAIVVMKIAYNNFQVYYFGAHALRDRSALCRIRSDRARQSDKAA
jgi:hypothetical protein